jgi:hypothetical protein
MALENMAASFSGLPMGDLIGGPLNASCDAQVRLAMATVNFIKVVGFEEPAKPETGTTIDPWSGDPRTAKFKFKRPVIVEPAVPPTPAGTDASGNPVPAVPGKAAVINVEEVEINVPVLAIVKIPSLSITQVDITFDMEVKSSESSKSSEDKSGSVEAQAKFGWGLWGGSVSIKGSVATHKENTRTSDNSAKYHVEVHAKDSGMPEGLARVLDILQQSVAPSKIGEAKPA